MAAHGPNAVLEHVRHLVCAGETSHLSDGQLLHLYCSRHDHEAFTVLLRRHERLVWKVCRCALGHQQDAEDAFQATFVVLARKAASICKQDSLASWLHGVAYRTALRARRDAARRQARDQRARAMTHDQPVSEKAWDDLQAALTAEVERLAAKYKAPFVLCHLEGKSLAEAARQLGWKVGTVSGRLTQARHLLEKGLARQGVTLAAVLTAAAISQGAVPAPVVEASAKAAMLIAAGRGPAGAVSAKAAALARGILKAMSAAKLRFGVVVVLALGAALLSGGTLAYQGLTGGPQSGAPEPAQAAAPELPPAEEAQPKGAADGVKPAAGPESPDVPQHPLQLSSVRIGSPDFRFPGQGMIAGCPDGRRALIFEPNENKPAKLVDLTTGSTIHAYPGLPPSNGARGLAFAAEDRAVYCDNLDNLCVFDLKTGAVVQRCEGVMKGGSEAHPITVSADGRRVAIPWGRRSGGKHVGQVLVYDVTAAKVVADARVDGFDVCGAALSADGKRFAVLGVGVDPQGQAAKRVDLLEVRDVESGKTVTRMEASVSGLAIPARFSPDGKYLAVAMWPGVEVWDTATGRSVWKQQLPYITALCFTPDSARLYSAAGFGEVHSWDAATGKAASPHKLPGAVDVGAGPVADMVLTPDSRLLAFGWRGVVLSTWDAKAGKLVTPTDGSTWPITAVRFTPDGRELIAATDALAVFRADARTGRMIARAPLNLSDEQRADPILSVHPTHMAAVALSPDTRFLAYPTRLRHLGVIDLTAGRVLWTAPAKGVGTNDFVTPVFSPDSTKVSAGGYFEPRDKGPASRSFLGWATATGKPLPPWDLGAVTLHTGIAGNAPVAFSPDGTRAAVIAELGWPKGERLLARDLAADQPLASVSGGFGQWIAVAPDNGTAVMTEANRIVGRDLVTGRVTRTLDFLPGSPGGEAPFSEFDGRRQRPKFSPDRVGLHLTCPFTFSPDGRLFAVGVIGHEIRVYEWAGFGHRFTLIGHAGSVRSLAFAPDGQFLASGSDDTTVLVWDLSKAWQAASPKVPSTGASLWTRLIGRETVPAWEAMRELAARPEIAVALVKERLKPAPPLTVTEADIPALIKQLDAEAFPERDRAVRGLRQLGHKAVPHLQQTLKNPPSLEVKRRAEQLLEEAGRPDPAFPTHSRAVEVLEHIGGPAARSVLQSLSGGAPGHPLTEEARAALRRMKS